MAKRAKSSEVHAYAFINDELHERGWVVRNPSRNANGQVWTQNECLADDEIKARLGLDRPESIIKVSEKILWIIEAKPEHKQLAQAIDEAVEYATHINKGSQYKVAFVSGVAGNPDDTYLVQTHLLSGRKTRPITINGKPITSLISREVAKSVLDKGPDIRDVPIDEELFLSKAERINQHLHLGAINKNYRARVMAALLLAMIDDTLPNIDAKPLVLISEINARAKQILGQHNKIDFYPFIEIAPPPTIDNHIKFKSALVKTIQELNNLNIRSAMNSGTDVLGKFYEVFLKYGNGAKEIGIVLTPRHITQFAVDVLGITSKDVIYDPTCGTAGFLVAAFDSVKKTASKSEIGRFKKYNMLGCEQEAEVVALALVNMIFRGDGKNNIVEGNCLQKHVARSGSHQRIVTGPRAPKDPAITKVLMNPPFALKDSDEKEYKFVSHALDQVQRGGLLFAVLPYPAMVKPGGYLLWRQSLLTKHTLLSVVTLPPDLFYPVGVHTVGIFIKKGIPHPAKQNVLWVRSLNDGLFKKKGKRLPDKRAPNDLEKVKSIVKSFVANPGIRVAKLEKFQKASPIDMGDELLELVPENYLDQSRPTDKEIESGVDQAIRDTLAFLIQNKMEIA